MEAEDPAPRRESLLYRFRVHLAHRRPDCDEMIAHSVRAALASVVAHPGALAVLVRRGHVVVRGPVMRGEEEALVDHAATVRGVVSVESRVEASDSAIRPASVERARGRRLMLHPTWVAYVGLVALGLGAAAAGVLGARSRPFPGLLRRLWRRLRARR